jgi:hypothetical protein
MGGMRNVYNILVRQSEGKRPLGRPRHRWEDNIKMIIEEIGCDGVDWIQMTQDKVQWQAFVNTGNKSSGSMKGREFLHQLSNYQFFKKDSAPCS